MRIGHKNNCLARPFCLQKCEKPLVFSKKRDIAMRFFVYSPADIVRQAIPANDRIPFNINSRIED